VTTTHDIFRLLNLRIGRTLAKREHQENLLPFYSV